MENCFEIKEVAPGARLCSYKTSRFKTGRISFNIAVPLGENTSANAILPYILNRSCKEFPAYIELNKKLASLYGATLTPSVSKSGEMHMLRLSMTMIDNKFAIEQGEDIILSCVNLLLGIVFDPNVTDGSFAESEVSREKRLMTERIESEKNDKRVYALRRCEEIMCGDEAFSINTYGTAEGVAALTPKSIYEAYTEVLKTGTISFHVVGNTDTDKIVALLLERLQKIDRADSFEMKCQVIPKAETVKKVTEEMDVNQGKLVMGFRSGSDDPERDYAYLRIMTDIFGGGTYSRLFMNVREKMSLCYYCSARFYRYKGIIIVQSGVENENFEPAIDEIKAQLKSLGDGNVSDEDMKASLLSMTDLYNSFCDTPEDIDLWAFSQIVEAVFVTPHDMIEKLSAVTKEQVVAAARAISLDTIFMLKATQEDE